MKPWFIFIVALVAFGCVEIASAPPPRPTCGFSPVNGTSPCLEIENSVPSKIKNLNPENLAIVYFQPKDFCHGANRHRQILATYGGQHLSTADLSKFVNDMTSRGQPHFNAQHYQQTARVVINEQIKSQLEQDECVLKVEMDSYLDINTDNSNDADCTDPSDQWDIKQIKAPLANRYYPSIWSCNYVIGTGVDWTHSGFAPNSVVKELGVTFLPQDQWGRDAQGNLLPPGLDDNDHDTGTASKISGTISNVRPQGANPGASIIPIKSFNSFGSGRVFDVTLALLYSICECSYANAPCVINMSFGGYGSNEMFKDAVDIASASGLLMFASAGNNGDNKPLTSDRVTYPAAYPGVIAVASSNKNRAVSYFSSGNLNNSLTAPGENVWLFGRGNGVYCDSGTSFSSPLAAAVGGLVLDKLSQRGIRGYAAKQCATAILLQSATDLLTPGYDIATGYGLVDMLTAVALADTFNCP